MKCGTPEAEEALGGGSPQSAEIRVESQQPGFGKGGTNVTDSEIPLSEIRRRNSSGGQP